jgi:hypothetical protein
MTPLHVLAYRRTRNLGDAIQAVAMCRLLAGRDVAAVYRDSLSGMSPPGGRSLLLNGWLGDAPPGASCVGVRTAGVYIGRNHADWVRFLGGGSRQPVGCRDPATYDLLHRHGVPALVVGCPTMTFPPYDGPRRGVFAIDAQAGERAIALTNFIPSGMAWKDQWNSAYSLLLRLRAAKRVWTNRLHVALPCLAFRTPVNLVSRGTIQEDRFSILDWLGIARSGWVTMPRATCATARRHYVGQLSTLIGDGPVETADLTAAAMIPLPQIRQIEQFEPSAGREGHPR